MIATPSARHAIDFVIAAPRLSPMRQTEGNALKNIAPWLLLHDDPFVLSRRRHCLPVQNQVSLREFGRRERRPLIERNVHESRTAKRFQKAQRFSAEILDDHGVSQLKAAGFGRASVVGERQTLWFTYGKRKANLNWI
jgi:hypothetical protein